MWVKAYLSHGPKTDALTNNMAESFNAKIEPYRCKSILTMSEKIRHYLMRRMTQHIKLLSGHEDKLAPVQEKRLARLMRPSTKRVADWAGDGPKMRFQVKKGLDETLSVDLVKHTCSCNLTGMLCVHGIAAIRKKRDKPENYVHKWLCIESIHATYRHHIQLVPSEKYWISSNYI